MKIQIKLISSALGLLLFLFTTVTHGQCISGQAICLGWDQKVVSTKDEWRSLLMFTYSSDRM